MKHFMTKQRLLDFVASKWAMRNNDNALRNDIYFAIYRLKDGCFDE